MAKPLTEQEISTITQLLKEGRSHNSIAKQISRSQSTISEFAKREGYRALPERTPHIANQARKDFAKAERLELLNIAFERGVEILQRERLSAREYREVMTGIAIGIDKRRLEVGEPDRLHETRSGYPHLQGTIDLEEEFRKLNEAFEQVPQQRRQQEEASEE